MAGASGGALAAQVSSAGAFGFIAAGYDSVESLKSQIGIARSILQSHKLDGSFFGVGFLAWQLDQRRDEAEKLVNMVLEHKAKAIWFAFGNDLQKWIKFVRDHDERKEEKTLVFVQVSSTEEARIAVEEWKIDVLVVQGIESGGHGSSHSPPLLTFLPSVLCLPALRGEGGVPVLAAGGLATGAHIAAMLALGASGSVLGTRFLLSPESLYTDVQKKALVDAKDNSTVRTMAFDTVRETLGWPAGIDGRALKNDTVQDFDCGTPINVLQDKFKEGTKSGNPSRMLVWSGTGVALMKEVNPAADIVLELHEECENHLKAVAQTLR
ncbi:NPD-domain-containing protein [Dendrothele bispora CBS 962.96]|uniref:NPD-domain-containing protein n=1 Tax=Dendrothele bispora (strain CBS 962.96) TaxID=1314807 RepID=A0A4S8M9U1_DENBC|nr:NPD-domain-containing protein [Dendrothele bispora CBS 962.96]